MEVGAKVDTLVFLRTLLSPNPGSEKPIMMRKRKNASSRIKSA
jgi:hypothetical protein